jgi:hypothetical protein
VIDEEREQALPTDAPDLSPDRGLFRDPSITRVLRIVVGLSCAALLLVGASTALGAGWDGLRELRADPADADHVINDQIECVRQKVEDQVPAGSTVYIAGPPGLWEQRLTDFAFRRATITADPARAQYSVAVVPPLAGEACGLQVTPS